MKFYLASPLGFSELGKIGLEVLKSRLRAIPGVEIHDPWEATPDLTVLAVGSSNYAAIQSCDGLIAVCDGAQVDDGTAAEIGYAYALGKRTMGYRGDFRKVGDTPDAVINAQVQHSLTGGVVYLSIDSLCNGVRVMVS